ncbi:hypothetical protein U9M48_018375 [Paspalum notatum var. saurae]|uniref:Uncharacterized protein n=1 Tax=Paspalum notatum var. saurae TaxID=547442 RepID=A0AAQ3WQ89_PASNO
MQSPGRWSEESRSAKSYASPRALPSLHLRPQRRAVLLKKKREERTGKVFAMGMMVAARGWAPTPGLGFAADADDDARHKSYAPPTASFHYNDFQTPSPSHLLELRLLPSHYPPRPVGDDDLRLPLVSCPRRLRESACHGWIHPERRRPYPSRGPSAGFPSQCLLFVATACGDGIGVEGINWFPSITGRPTFNLSSWFGIPGNLKLLRNSVGYIWSKLPLFVVALLTVSELWKRCWHGALPELAS